MPGENRGVFGNSMNGFRQNIFMLILLLNTVHGDVTVGIQRPGKMLVDEI